jgi:50S ribosomal subunit-associated GTPase HflX
VDAADPHFRRQIAAVEEVLDDILETPRPTTLVFNKVDLIRDPDLIAGLRAEFPDSFTVSAVSGEGLDELREFLWAQSAERAARAAS